MVREELRPLEQRTKDNEARLAWLRGAASEAFASLDRGEGLQFESMDELENYNF
jgi:Arc/MetJ-type ribon-helix-helix transcriptional regulator